MMKKEMLLQSTSTSQTTCMNKIKVLLGLLVGCSLGLQAQTPSALMKEYKDEDAVRLEGHNETQLSIKDDQILITNRHSMKTFLNDKNVNGRGEVSLNYEPPFSEITDIEAYTLVPNFEKDKYDKEKVRDFTDRKVIDEDVFHDGTRAKSFTFEGMMQGAITVLEYEEEYHEPFLVGREVFDPYMYSKSQHFSLIVEEGIEIEYQYFNCDSSFFEHWVDHDRDETTHHWRTAEMKSRKWESGSPSSLYLSPHIVYRIKSFVKSDGQVEKVMGDVSDLHRYYQRFLSDLESPDAELKSLTDSLTKGLETPRAKAKAIYDWVNHSIRYIAFEDGYGGFRPREANFVCTKRYGDCKDMGNLLVQMMTYAGLEAHHVWIGTRSIPYTYEEVPTGLSDNHMIAALKLDGEYYFLDATNKNLPFPYPSSFIQGKQALINLGPEAFDLKTVPVLDHRLNDETDSCFLKLEGNNLVGEGHKHYGVYHRSNVLRILERKDEEAMKNFLKYDLQKGDNRCKSELKNHEITEDGFELNYSMRLDRYARVAGNKTIINLNLEQILASNSLEEDRKNPMELNNTTLFKRYFELEIPENYSLNYLPENSSYDHPKFSYTISYKQEGNKVIYEIEIALKTLFVEVEDLQDWNEFIRKLRKEYQQTLILNPNEN